MPDFEYIDPVVVDAIANHEWPHERELPTSSPDVPATHRELLKAVAGFDQPPRQSLCRER